MRRTMLGILIAVALAATACGDDGSSGDEADGEVNEDAAPTSDPACDPDAPIPSGTTEATFDDDGVERTYRVSVPEGHDGSEAAPVIVNLHGFTSTAEQQDLLSGLADEGPAAGYVVVSPQGLDTPVPIGGGVVAPFWNITSAVDTSQLEEATLEGADDIGFLNALLDQLEGDLCLDPEREYLTGMSNGAAMSMALLCDDDERFAAAAPVAGAVFVSDCGADELTPILAVHGDADVLAPYDGGDVLGFPLGLPGAVDQLSALADVGGCDAEPALEMVGDDVERRTWSGCADGADIVLYTVLGGGHTWPGSPTFEDLSAEDLADGGGSEQAAQAEQTFGFDLQEILGEPTDTIDVTELVLEYFDRH
ncbi:MAG: hypothetical protein AAGK32_07035, partial [Actinomycetota bacterium]